VELSAVVIFASFRCMMVSLLSASSLAAVDGASGKTGLWAPSTVLFAGVDVVDPDSDAPFVAVSSVAGLLARMVASAVTSLVLGPVVVVRESTFCLTPCY